MKIQLSKIQWGKGVLFGVLIPIISFLVVSFIIFIYGFTLGFQARGMPDVARINQFAHQFAPLASPLLSILLLVGAATWIGRKTPPATYENGVFTGIIVAVIGLGFSVISHDRLYWDELIWFILAIGAGLFGGFLATLSGRAKESLVVK